MRKKTGNKVTKNRAVLTPKEVEVFLGQSADLEPEPVSEACLRKVKMALIRSISETLETKKLSGRSAAKILHISPSAMSQLLRNHKKFTLDFYLEKLCLLDERFAKETVPRIIDAIKFTSESKQVATFKEQSKVA